MPHFDPDWMPVNGTSSGTVRHVLSAIRLVHSRGLRGSLRSLTKSP
jgi:hypothetical protein